MDPTSADYLIDPYAPAVAPRVGFSPVRDIPAPVFVGLGLCAAALYLLLRKPRRR